MVSRRMIRVGIVILWGIRFVDCRIPKCTNRARARGMCNTHYARWYREQKAMSRGQTVAPRGSEEWKQKISEANRKHPRTQWLDDYWRFMPAKERRKEYRRRGKLPRTIYKKVCEWCEDEYTTTQPTYARFCSPKCRSAAYWDSYVQERVCEVCGVEFTAYGNRTPGRTCSHSCAGKLGAKMAWEKHGTGKRLGTEVSV